MTTAPKTNIPLVSPDASHLESTLSTYIAKAVESTQAKEFHIAISGGSLLKTLAQVLKSGSFKTENWVIWLADERLVSLSSEDSNAGGFIKACEDISYDGIKKEQIKWIDGNLEDPTKCASDYAEKLRSTIKNTTDSGIPVIDLVLLGIGPDGHTCSLFPGRDHKVSESQIIGYVVDSPKPPKERITFELPLLEAARTIIFVVTGDGKAEALKSVFTDDKCTLPAKQVQDLKGPIIRWLVDVPANSALIETKEGTSAEDGVLGPASSLPFQSLWLSMCEKAYHPDIYLPVEDIVTNDIQATPSTPAHIHRQMNMKGGGKAIIENIFLEEDLRRVRFASVQGDDQVVINQYYNDTGEIHYWMQNSQGEKIKWKGPTNEMIIKSIVKHDERGRILEREGK